MDKDAIQAAVARKVIDTFLGRETDWRTLGGIARESGLAVVDVSEYVETHPAKFVQSSVAPGGTRLYRMRPEAAQAAGE